ncbi:MAG: hypothetical protein DCC67_17285, partial [Planctomycetota bacterium]
MNVATRHERLRQRARLLQRLRRFFEERGFLEVETPLVDAGIIPELHIEPLGVWPAKVYGSASHDAASWIATRSGPGGCEPPARIDSPMENSAERHAMWLQASPELHMKRLLAEGLPAIYQITRSFRHGERGRLHNPEFTIVEWYRTG